MRPTAPSPRVIYSSRVRVASGRAPPVGSLPPRARRPLPREKATKIPVQIISTSDDELERAGPSAVLMNVDLDAICADHFCAQRCRARCAWIYERASKPGREKRRRRVRGRPRPDELGCFLTTR